MEVGDTVKFQFGRDKAKKSPTYKEGTIIRLFEKTVYIQSDFPKHKGKLIRRKRSQIS